MPRTPRKLTPSKVSVAASEPASETKVVETTESPKAEPVAKMQPRPARRRNISGPRDILTVKGNLDPDYVYRIVNDRGDRVAKFEDMGYEVVKDNSLKIGDARVGRASDVGSPVTATVSETNGDKGILMRIPKEFYDEDFKAKMEYVDKTEESMYEEAKKGSDYGKISINR